MTGLVYTNNAQSLLRTAIGTTDTTITVFENEGFLFPDITEEDNSWFPLTLINPDDSTYEIVRATARDGDTITVLRAQENTPNASSFSEGTIVSLRMSAAGYDTFLKSGVDTFIAQLGLNLAVQTNNERDVIELSLAGFDEFREGMNVSFISNATEASTSTFIKIKLNDLDEKVVVTSSKLAGSQQWQAGDFRPGVLHTVAYSTVDDRWYLISPGTLGNPARDLVPGIVSGMLSGNRKYDPVNEPSELTGYPEFADARDVSLIIDDYVAQNGGFGGSSSDDEDENTLLSRIPELWKWYGDGSLGDISGNNSLQLSLNFAAMYGSVNITSGGYIRTRDGNAIVRATDSMIIGGELNPRQASTHLYPLQYYGPDGDLAGNTQVPSGKGIQHTYSDRTILVTTGIYRNR